MRAAPWNHVTMVTPSNHVEKVSRGMERCAFLLMTAALLGLNRKKNLWCEFLPGKWMHKSTI